MLHPVTFRTLAIAACGWLLAGEAGALTLGRASGAVLVGRPLELAVPVTLDGPDSGDGPCATGELFYGEQKVVRPPTFRWEPGPGAQGTLRVSSPQAVDEPMVTLFLRVGCGQSTQRRYVLLSEVPSASEPSAPLVPRSAGTPVPPPGSVAVQPPLVAAPPPRTAAAAPRAAAPVARPPAAPAIRARKPEVLAQAAPQPRLRVEPLDLTTERDPILRLTSELASQVAADPQKRAAAAALWAALQKGPDEAIQDAIRLQGVEKQVNALRAETQQNATAVTQMRDQVDAARGQRNFATALVIALGVALAALLAFLGWRWQRASRVDRVGRWFEAHGQPVPPAVVPGVAQGAEEAAAAASLQEPTSTEAAVSTASGWNSSDFQASRNGSVRMVGVDELLDVHDKADFFLSIGEYDQAIAVLEAHVHDQVETSALAWMDLLELYHSLGKRADFDRLRGEFRQRFTAQVPDFEHFAEPTASLENYSRALSRIVALWPSRRVLDVIEESIFRKPGLPGAEPFSLEAYRELVLLYHVAKEVAPPEQGKPAEARNSAFSDTSLQPLNMLDMREASQDERDHLLIPPASSRLGVDIDLGDLDAPVAEAPDAELPPLDFDMSEFDDLAADDNPRRR